jgi:hypothetical protein
MQQLARLALFAMTMMVVSIGFVPGGISAQEVESADPWLFR